MSELSRVIFGAMAMGPRGSSDERARIATIRAAIDAGCTSIDTAPLYEFGRSEELVGRAIRELRGRVQVLTKVGLRWDDAHGEVLFAFRDEQGAPRTVRRDSRPHSVRAEVEASLRRLGVDVLDLVQVHHRDRGVPIAETLGALADLQRAGSIREIGVCNFEASEVAEAQRALGAQPLRSHQLHYSLLSRDAERERIPQAQGAGIAVLAYSPLEQGLLAGRTADSFEPGDGRRGDARFQRANVAAVEAALREAVAPAAQRLSASFGQVALAWGLAQPGLSAVIVGASSPEQARANAAAAQLRLTPEELRAIRAAFEAVRFDPHAGSGALQRMRQLVRRAIGRARRSIAAR